MGITNLESFRPALHVTSYKAASAVRGKASTVFSTFTAKLDGANDAAFRLDVMVVLC
jgi:hypothetical protein